MYAHEGEGPACWLRASGTEQLAMKVFILEPGDNYYRAANPIVSKSVDQSARLIQRSDASERSALSPLAHSLPCDTMGCFGCSGLPLYKALNLAERGQSSMGCTVNLIKKKS
jgi:hypothetical protein